MSMYILAADDVGNGTISRLTDAASRGCDVRLIYDAFGSNDLRDRHLRPLIEAGGALAEFNPLRPVRKLAAAWRIRNHRKLIIVDREAALCGGLNLNEDYCASFGDDWIFDDTVALVEGPCVIDFMKIFGDTWLEVTQEEVDLPDRPGPLSNGLRVQVLETDPRSPQTKLREMLSRAISKTEELCRIVTPYFVPPDWLTSSLIEAAKRGADVRVMTAGRTDFVVAREAGRSCYGPLLDAGVRIYEMFGRMLHAKTVTIDGVFGTVGSYNLDEWTARHALDVAVAVVDQTFATSLEEEFDEFGQEASEFTKKDYARRGIPTRAVQWAARRLAQAV